MDSSPRSTWCRKQLRQLEKDGRPHADICTAIHDMFDGGCITEECHDEMLRMAAGTPFTVILDSRTDGPATEETLAGRAQLQVNPTAGSQIFHEIPHLSPIEASEYRHIHNRVFNIDTVSASRVPRNTAASGSRLGRLLKTLISCTTSPSQDFTSNRFQLEIRVDIPGGPARPCILLLDTGSDFNILGPQLVQLLGAKVDLKHAAPLANTPGGGRINTLGRMSVRWYCLDEQLKNRFVESEFEMSATDLDVDAILGWNDILKFGLVSMNVRSVRFISKSSHVNQSTAMHEQAAAEARRHAEADEMRRDAMNRDYERQRIAYANNQARQCAQVYAQQHRALYGEARLREEYEKRYNEAYSHYYYAYPQHSPLGHMQ